MFNYGLAAAVDFFVNNVPFFVSIYQIRVLGTLQYSSVFVFRALGC
jgi:hypothetical protein